MKDSNPSWPFVVKIAGSVIGILIVIAGYMLSTTVEDKCRQIDRHEDKIQVLEKNAAVRTSEVLHMKDEVKEIKEQNKSMLQGLHRLEVRFGTLPDSLRK
jgi:Tfp pilus assembly protein PilO